MFYPPGSPSRRQFLLKSIAATTSVIVPRMLSAQAESHRSSAASEIPSRDTRLKFNADGSARPFAGNTVICHLPPQCAMLDPMSRLHDAFAASSLHQRLGLTPVPSYHMTIFPGTNDKDRSVTGWPAYVPQEAPIDLCNRLVGERMAKARLKCDLPIRVRIEQSYTLQYPNAVTLRMSSAGPDEERKIRSLRDQLAEIYGFRTKDHDRYEFHITIAYKLQTFAPQEQVAYTHLLQQFLPLITAAAPVLELGIPEYCTFTDMFRFEPQVLLRCS